MSQLQTIEKDLREVLSSIEFNKGNRYGDYVAGVDKVVAYGVGALLVGKLAAKVGLFKLLLVFAAKSWKLLIIAALAIGAFVKKLFSRRRKKKSLRAPRNKELS